MGRDGRLFNIYKFRTMRTNAETTSGPVWAKEGDPRTTRIGAILRRLSIDELPQLWNVFIGDMSLVGPRPERPFFIDQFRTYIPKYMDRHLVRSGLTGWAQANGLRGEEGTIEERTRYDIYYVENWSLLFDIRIIVKTALEVLSHKAY
ncbi:UDP-N-acetylgalactosamine-undecaprenyl-phosphate N-acetylgalactosaminephosphotransferase [compost metagenome]